MDDIKTRLIKCFETVFPDLQVSEIPAATQDSIAAWDSIAAITLVNVIEDEFQTQLDMEELADLDSFDRVLSYLEGLLQNGVLQNGLLQNGVPRDA
jgi:acyl carrier protein